MSYAIAMTFRICALLALLGAAKVSSVPLKLGETTVHASIHEQPGSAAVMVVLHDDENTAPAAAKAVIARMGGRLVELKAQGKRFVTFALGGKKLEFDPNRIFTDRGTAFERQPPAAVAQMKGFAAAILELLPGKTIVALHNNTDGEPLSVRSYQPGGKYARDAAEVSVSPGADEDDFFLVTERALFLALKQKGFNVVLQDNAAVTDDGSLSVYCGRKGTAYVNVEAQHGHQAEQERMLEALLAALD